MPSKSAFFRFRQWLPFQHGGSLNEWVRWRIHSREICHFHLVSVWVLTCCWLKTHFPSLGRHRAHTGHVLVDVYIHRSEEQLSSGKHSHSQVCRRYVIPFFFSLTCNFLATSSSSPVSTTPRAQRKCYPKLILATTRSWAA